VKEVLRNALNKKGLWWAESEVLGGHGKEIRPGCFIADINVAFVKRVRNP